MRENFGVGFFDSDYKYGCGILTKIIDMDLVKIQAQKIYFWVLNLAKSVNKALKISL